MGRPPRTPAHRLFIAFSAVLTLAVGYYAGNLYSLRKLKHDVGASLLDPPGEITPFALIDHRAEGFDKDRLRDHWTLIYRGCVSCAPGRHPVLSVLAQIHNRLADNPRLQESMRFVILSSDPAEDTPERMEQTLFYYNPEFLGVSGDTDTLEALTRELGMVPRGAVEAASDGPAVGSSPLVVVSPQAQVFGIFSGWLDAEAIANDLKRIAERFGP